MGYAALAKPSFQVAAFCVLAAIGFSGCASKPTVVRETSARNFGGAPALLGPIVVDEAAVVVDARPMFDFSIARIPRSVPINWADYSEREPGLKGWPQKDVFAAARRLARLGISPKSKVIVLGNGKDGQGEEGRVAWMLAYLGVDNVRFGRFGAVKAKLTNAALPGFGETIVDPREEKSAWEKTKSVGKELAPEEAPVVAAPIWKPVLVPSLIASREEVKAVIENQAAQKPMAFSAKGKKGKAPAATAGRAKLYRLIDVRPEKEYLGQSGGLRAQAIPNIDAINIPMREFFDDDFRPLADLGPRLAAVGILPEHRVVVIDNDGIGSAAVTMALRALGYADAACYAGGYNDLLQ